MRLGFLTMMCCLCVPIFAQVSNSNGKTPAYLTPSSQLALTHEEDQDSFQHRYVHIAQPDRYLSFQDTSLDRHFEQYDLTLKRDIPYLNMGNLGSASFNPLYQSNKSTGFNLGLNQYEIYNSSMDSFRFYESNHTFADLMFTNYLGAQNNFYVKADYGQQFSDGLALAINFDRISQVGYYKSQNTKSTNFGISARYRSKTGKFNSFLTYIDIVNQETNNGGVTDTTLFFLTNYNFRERIPVKLADAITRHDRKTIYLSSQFAPWKKDSVDFGLVFQHELAYEFSYYKFTDKDVALDSTYYGPFILDARGIRYYTHINRLSNKFAVQGQLGKFSGLFSLVHDLYYIKEESKAGSRNDVTLAFEGKVDLPKLANIHLNAQLGIGANIGKFDLGGEIAVPVAHIATLNIGANLFRSVVPYVFEHLRLNDQNVYTNDFSAPFGSELKAELVFTKANLALQFKQDLVTGQLYWKDAYTPAQLGSAYSNTSLGLQHQIKLWKIGFRNGGYYQVNSDKILPLSPWLTTHNLYFESLMFKKVLLLRLGGELRLMPSYPLPSFMPVLGQFYVSEDRQPIFPGIDLYLTAKVSKFRLFFKIENFTRYFRKQINYEISKYPQLDQIMRLGIRWQLLD